MSCFNETVCNKCTDFSFIQYIQDLNKIYEFHKTMPKYSPTALHEFSQNVFIKDESNRFTTNSFKILGASYAIFSYFRDLYPGKINDFYDLKKYLSINKHTICSASDGNFGVAIAWFCNLLSQKCIIFSPDETPLYYKEKLKSYGAEVKFIDGDYDKCVNNAISFSKSLDIILVLDTSVEEYASSIPMNNMLEYSTIFYELQNMEFDYIFLPAGVGGLAAFAIYYYRTKNKIYDKKFITVEPMIYNSVQCSINKGEIVQIEGGQTLINGLKCGKPSLCAWEALKYGIHEAISIDDDSCELAYYDFKRRGISTGYTGASAFAGYTEYKKQNKEKLVNKKILIINSEKTI